MDLTGCNGVVLQLKSDTNVVPFLGCNAVHRMYVSGPSFGPALSEYSSLAHLEVRGIRQPVLDLSNCGALRVLDLGVSWDSQLSSLQLGGCSSLQQLKCNALYGVSTL